MRIRGGGDWKGCFETWGESYEAATAIRSHKAASVFNRKWNFYPLALVGMKHVDAASFDSVKALSPQQRSLSLFVCVTLSHSHRNPARIPSQTSLLRLALASAPVNGKQSAARHSGLSACVASVASCQGGDLSVSANCH